MKILILGHAQHGKDTLAKIIAEYMDLRLASATYIAGRDIIYPQIKHIYGYETLKECIDDRGNHRKDWHDLIRTYNTPDLTRHVKNVLLESDIYIGLRNPEEYQAARSESIFELTIGIYDPSKPLESESSMGIDIFKESDFVIYAKESGEELERSIYRIFTNLRRR